MVKLEEMTFERRNVQEPEALPETKSRREDLMRWLLLI